MRSEEWRKEDSSSDIHTLTFTLDAVKNKSECRPASNKCQGEMKERKLPCMPLDS